MINRLIKNFCFIEEERNNLILSDTTKIRLNTEDKSNQRIMFVKSNGKFTLDADIHVETKLIEPHALIKWLGFEAIYKTNPVFPANLDLPTGTSIGFKVKTSGDDYWWDGGAWAVAGASDWSTEKQINDNISTFPIATVGNKKIGFKMNIVTTDETVTPEIFELKLLGEFDIEYFDDLVYDSVIRLLNTTFRPISIVVFNSGSSSISAKDLSSVLANKGYNIFDVKSVYNITDDPLKLTNLHSSYAVGAPKQDGFTFEHGTETFTGSISANKFVRIEFIYVPEIVIKVNQDYFEVPTYPTIAFTRIQEVARRGFLMHNTNSFGRDSVRDKTTNMAVEQRSPSQKSYRFTFLLYTTEIDQFRLTGALKNFFANTKKLITHGLANEHALEIIDEIDTVGNSKTNDSSDTNLSKGTFDVLGVLFYDKPSVDVPIITSLNLNLTKQ